MYVYLILALKNEELKQAKILKIWVDILNV